MVIRQTINEKRASIIKIKGNGYSNFEKLLRGKGCSTPFRYVTGGIDAVQFSDMMGGGGVKRQTHLHNYVQLVLKRKTMLGIYQWKVSLSKLSLIPDYDYIVCFD